MFVTLCQKGNKLTVRRTAYKI